MTNLSHQQIMDLPAINKDENPPAQRHAVQEMPVYSDSQFLPGDLVHWDGYSFGDYYRFDKDQGRYRKLNFDIWKTFDEDDYKGDWAVI